MIKTTQDILLGAHMSIAGGFHLAIKRGESIGATAIQIFTKSNRSWFDKKIPDEASDAFKAAQKASAIDYVVTHASYLINLGSSNQETACQSTNALADELKRCAQLDIPHIVLHPGAHTGQGVEKGIEQIARNLDLAFEKADCSTMVLLETMAGQGTTLGSTFEELKSIRNLSSTKKQIGICLDTCHIFSANYNISTEKDYHATMKLFDDILGFDLLKCMHINDSLKPLGSHLDRHAPLGEGTIPLDTFSYIINDKNLTHVPKILETPTDDEMKLYAKEIKLLRSMIR